MTLTELLADVRCAECEHPRCVCSASTDGFDGWLPRLADNDQAVA